MQASEYIILSFYGIALCNINNIMSVLKLTALHIEICYQCDVLYFSNDIFVLYTAVYQLSQ